MTMEVETEAEAEVDAEAVEVEELGNALILLQSSTFAGSPELLRTTIAIMTMTAVDQSVRQSLIGRLISRSRDKKKPQF